MSTVRAAAHVITSTATWLGDPEVLVMTPDEGQGARIIERIHVPDSRVLDSPSELTYFLHISGWAATGAPTEVDLGYLIVDVESTD